MTPSDKRAETKKYMEKYYQKNKKKIVSTDRFKRTNCTPEQYEDAKARQSNKCAVCIRPERIYVRGKRRGLAADHNHDTGLFRGLLCTACNVALGQLQDDPVRVRALLEYLERN